MVSRVALLHFTAEPCVGGVEHVMEEQRRVLSARGVDVRLIVGAGGLGNGVTRYPQMLPPVAGHGVPVPAPEDPGIEQMATELEAALADCTDCWIHNALTVYLHPAITIALLRVIRRCQNLRWTAFCHDLTPESVYWREIPAAESSRLRLPRDGVRYVVDSAARRDGVARLAGVPRDDVLVMPLPLDSTWFASSAETRRVMGEAGNRDRCIILVPSKLLPHKGLDTAVLTVAGLAASGTPARLLITGPPSPHQPDLSERIRHQIYALARQAGVEDSVVVVTDVLGHPPARGTMRELMLLADLVLLPSTEEGYGLPLQEAIALRAPVLCSDIPSFREIGTGCAQFFSLGSTPVETAAMAKRIITAPSANMRRRLIASSHAYEERLVQLLKGA